MGQALPGVRSVPYRADCPACGQEATWVGTSHDTGVLIRVECRCALSAR